MTASDGRLHPFRAGGNREVFPYHHVPPETVTGSLKPRQK
jgi:hypothetical protein